MLVCIDGTGPFGDKEYTNAMKGSFVNQIHDSTKIRPKVYYRGPDNSGVTWKLKDPDDLAREIVKKHVKGKPIFMTGYSRGGAIVINTASILRKKGLGVEALFLFDAVDKSIRLEAKEIQNVKVAYHAIRDSRTSSRESFGNCGLHKGKGVKLIPPQKFYTTHGGMGGTPWGVDGIESLSSMIDYALSNEAQRKVMRDKLKVHEGMGAGKFDGKTNVTLSQEIDGMNSVRTWMWKHLIIHGVVV